METAPPADDYTPLKDILLGSGRILVLDGGVSTHLEDKLNGRSFPYRKLWSSSLLLDSEGRNLILEGHKDWLKAGANILSTVTYQCHYESHLWPQDVITTAIMDEMWKDGICMGRQAIQAASEREAWLAASSGCYGAALANGAEYTGNYGDVTIQDLCEFHRHKWQRAAEFKPDAIGIETIPSLLECQALVKLLTDSSIPAGNHACWISLSCRNGSELNDGTPLQTALDTLRAIPVTQLQAIGLNCCDSQYLESLTKILVDEMALKGPVRAIVVYPNSGEAWDAKAETWKEGTGCTVADQLAVRLLKVIEAMEQQWKQLSSDREIPTIVVGGCCRTRPDAIAALRRRVDEHLLARTCK